MNPSSEAGILLGMARDSIDVGHATQVAVAGFNPVHLVRRSRSGPVVAARRDSGTGLHSVKWLVPSIATDPEALGRLRSDIARLHGVGHQGYADVDAVYETTEGAIVIGELAEGVVLRDILNESGPLSLEASAVLAFDLLDALAWIHHAGVIHRDLTPDAVLVDSSGQPQLLDIGIAAPVYENADAAGTPAYIAPEVWNGAAPSAASDVYAVGIVVAEALTGVTPITARRVAAMRAHHLRATPNLAGIPEPWSGLIARALAKAPGDRQLSAALFRDQVARMASEQLGKDWINRGRAQLAARVLAGSAHFPAAVVSGMADNGPVLPSMPAHPNRIRQRLVGIAIAGAAAVLIATAALAGFRGAGIPSAHLGTTPVPHVTKASHTPTATPIVTPSPTVTPTPTPRPSVAPVQVVFPTPSPTPTASPKPTSSPTPSPTPTSSPTPTP